MIRLILPCALLAALFVAAGINAGDGSMREVAPELIAAAISHPDRSTADRERDMRSKPEQILPLLELDSGGRVVDVFAGGGYYSELLAYVVGESGKVIVYNNEAYRAFTGKELDRRFQDKNLKQIEQTYRPADNMGLPEGQLDAALMIMSLHDLYFVQEPNWPKKNPQQFLQQIFQALKPGGRFLVVDHQAAAGRGKEDAQELHRIEDRFVQTLLENNGFQLQRQSDLLRNKEDKHADSVFAPERRGNSDRFVHVYIKPLQ